MLTSVTSSGEPADVRVDSEWCGWPDGLRSASFSYGWLGCCWIWPDSEHTAMEVSLQAGQWSGRVRVEAAESAKYILCFSVHDYELMSIFISGQLSEYENCIFFFLSPPFLSLFLSIVWVNWEFYRITAWQFLPVVWFLIIAFIFLFWKNDKEITVPTKMISTYRKSCRTSYTSFYCITVSL